MLNTIGQFNAITIKSMIELHICSLYSDIENTGEPLSQLKNVYDSLYEFVYEKLNNIDKHGFPITYSQYYISILQLINTLQQDELIFIEDKKRFVVFVLDILSHIILYADYHQYYDYCLVFFPYRYYDKIKQNDEYFKERLQYSLNTMEYIINNLDAFVELLEENMNR